MLRLIFALEATLADHHRQATRSHIVGRLVRRRQVDIVVTMLLSKAKAEAVKSSLAGNHPLVDFLA